MATSVPTLFHAPLLVGRERELAMLRQHLDAALAGHGELMLISGEAGIGKTALAAWLCGEASERGALVMAGWCYDLTETPPYGPWTELFGRYHPSDALPPLPSSFAERGLVGQATSQAALFQQVRAFVAAVAAQRPLVLLLDDLHWTDPASLDLLRVVARSLSDLPVLILATYRADELIRGHPLAALLPALVRESTTTRVELYRLTEADIRTLVTARYSLADADTDRLIVYLHHRSDGNPYFLGELLRTLEAERLLYETTSGWMLADVSQTRVPTLLLQVIEGRIARLAEPAQRLLAVAAVIGQEVSLNVWASVTGSDEETLASAVEQAAGAHLLDESGDGVSVRFVHALVRASLYEGIVTIRRRTWHRRVADELAVGPHADPDMIAYHYRQAGDTRAIEWLLKAGERAERSYAWKTAADRFEAATILLKATSAEKQKCGWLYYRVGWLRRFADLGAGIAALEEALRFAADVQDAALTAYALHALGTLHCRVYQFRRGLAELEAGSTAIEALPMEVRVQMQAHVTRDLARELSSPWGAYVLWLAFGGRYAEAHTVGERMIERAASTPDLNEEIARSFQTMYYGLGLLHAALGQPEEGRAAFRTSQDYIPDDNLIGNANVVMNDLEWIVLPYHADCVSERNRLAGEIEELFAQATGALSNTQPRGLGYLSIWLLEGRWEEARALAIQGYTIRGNANSRLIAMRTLSILFYHYGEYERAWGLVREWLPSGAATEPGDTYFLDTLLIQRLAARLAIDEGDLPTAHAWLAAYDRWLEWSGTVVGKADGHLTWAIYHRATGDVVHAYRHASAALTMASTPRQPLTLLSAHRLLGQLDTDAGQYDRAATHLKAALALADACQAPFERALTFVALATLRGATGEREAALMLLDEVRAICTPLGAAPTLARTDAIASYLTTVQPLVPLYPDGLSAREVDVLRPIAAGHTNREIADMLFLSVRTVERHITSLYRKIDARGRADATAYAVRHGFLPTDTHSS